MCHIEYDNLKNKTFNYTSATYDNAWNFQFSAIIGLAKQNFKIRCVVKMEVKFYWVSNKVLHTSQCRGFMDTDKRH